MEKELYAKIYEHEKNYWWAVNKRRHLFRLIDRHLGNIEGKKVLDVGCGTGCLLKEIKELKKAEVYGLDFSNEVKEFCELNGLTNISQAPAEELPFNNNEFDLITSLDVIEHIENDVSALKECYRTLKVGGIAVFSVPAFNFLWSNRDDRLMHKRRYSRAEFNSKTKEAGFTIIESKYVNLLLIIPMLATSTIPKILGLEPRVKTDIAYYSPTINKLLYWMNLMEYRILDTANVPIGTSLFTVVQKS